MVKYYKPNRKNRQYILKPYVNMMMRVGFCYVCDPVRKIMMKNRCLVFLLLTRVKQYNQPLVFLCDCSVYIVFVPLCL